MIDEAAAMRAWLDAHDLAEAELLHHLANYGPDGADRLTGPERQLLSALLEDRRAVIPGYRRERTSRPTPQDRADAGELMGLFDPSPAGPPQRAAVEPASHRTRPADRPTARHHNPRPSAIPRREQRERDEEQER